jgi:hypothetical protein
MPTPRVLSRQSPRFRTARLALCVCIALYGGACAGGARTAAPVAYSASTASVLVPAGLSGLTTLRGVLVDSLVSHDTLRGAVVVLDGREGFVLTNERGAFAFDSVPRGAHRLRIRHPILDSIGIGELPLALLVQDSAVLPVALPTADAYLAALCAPVRAGSEGALLGTVRRASDDALLPNREVVGAWRSGDSSFAGSGVRPRMRVRTNAEGRYVMCHVPRFSPVELWATTVAGERSEDVPHLRVQLGSRTLGGYDISLTVPDSTRALARPAGAPSVDPNVRVMGRILTVSGDALPNVTVSFDQPRRRAVTDHNGRFVMDSVPPGLRTLEVRSIGFQPQRLGLNVRPGQQVDQDITIDRNLAVLGTFMVRASRTATWDSTGFEERRRKGTGYFFTREALTGVNDLSTALRMVPGIRGRSSDRSQRLVAGRGAGCYPAFVVNRVRFDAGGAIGPEAMIRAQDIRAMEVYTSRLATPPDHQRYGDCAVIVIWLRDPQAEIEARKK